MAVVACVAGLVAGCSSGSTSSTTTTSKPTTTTTSSGLSTAAIKTLQRQLVVVGCYTGSVDGIVGSATTTAIRNFQSAEGLAVDGIYGAQTQAKLIAAAAIGKKVCTSSSTTTTTPTSTTASSTTTTSGSGSGVPAAALSAIYAYETKYGPPVGTWQVTSSKVSTVDPSYVYFTIGPAPGHTATVQGGYGFAHGSGSSWAVIGFGTAEVGCASGSGNTQAVPTNVLAGFGLTCPTS